jgi:aspartyl aminopeptidase
MDRKWAWAKLKENEVNNFAEGYKRFLQLSKTEREAARYIIEEASKNGFKFIEEYDKLEPGNKVMALYKNKLVILAVIGEKDPRMGLRIIGSHIDTPRIDLKPVPIYEEAGFAMLKTHYYGGVKRYQWVNIPLAIHGIVALKNGEVKEVIIGEKEDEPIFVIPDLLPHLARRKQGERKGFEIIKGEELRVLIGNKPRIEGTEKKEERESVKKAILNILREKYGIEEEDLISAELQLVPAFKPRDAGLDRSMIAAYGQDDRICAYTSLMAILGLEKPEYTAVAIFTDREEIGSEGVAGAKSRLIDLFIGEVITKFVGKCDARDLFTCYANSKAISADVNAAINPIYKDVHDSQNAGHLGKGVIVTKYTGRGGKYGASEANAEFIAWIRRILDERGVPWQPGLLGKVDEGGGGTIAKFIAEKGVDILDIGPGIVGMHSPYEISSKADVYSTYLAYKAFYEAK